MLREPQSFTVKDQKGVEHTYQLGKWPAIAGREIVAKYPLSALPKLGEYAVNEETMLKLMAFVGVETGPDTTQLLTTRALVDSHIPDWETLAKVEWASFEYNTSFFGPGKTLPSFANFGQTLKAWITSTLTDLSVQLLQAAKQHSKN